MRSFAQALQDHELIVLRVIGEWWELDLTGTDKAGCVKALAAFLAQLDIVQEMAYLPPEEAAAMKALVQAGGRLPVAAFTREHGDVRLMGPGRLEREEPWFDPASPAEALWYRGFLYRGFDETAEGMIEFFYLPQEMVARFPAPAAPAAKATPTAVSTLSPVSPPKTEPDDVTQAVDDLTTLLLLTQQRTVLPADVAALAPFFFDADKERWSLLLNLGLEMGLLQLQEKALKPVATAVSWLQQSREAQLRALAEAWSSSNWNELCHTPGLRCEGDQWQNDPILARTALLDALPRSAAWFRLDDLVTAVKENDPDFQRPDGNYDVWYVRDVAQDSYLNGFENWDLVEGRLLRFLVRGPMVWLGLAVGGEETLAAGTPLFRLTDRALEWLAGTAPEAHEVNVPLLVQADGTILAAHNASRLHRFQAGRISESLPLEPGKPFVYRLTPRSLAQAKKQGITPERILKFLADSSGTPLPPSTRRGIERWQEVGMEGRLETAVILRVREAAILETLRQNPKTRDFLGESLGELAVALKPDAWPQLRAAVAQLGLLLDVEVN